jgi:Transposase, Mutator family
VQEIKELIAGEEVERVELRVPQDRQGRFSSELFEPYQRSEKALVGALAGMYIQGVSTRKVKAITEELANYRLQKYDEAFAVMNLAPRRSARSINAWMNGFPGFQSKPLQME